MNRIREKSGEAKSKNARNVGVNTRPAFHGIRTYEYRSNTVDLLLAERKLASVYMTSYLCGVACATCSIRGIGERNRYRHLVYCRSMLVLLTEAPIVRKLTTGERGGTSVRCLTRPFPAACPRSRSPMGMQYLGSLPGR